MKRICKCFIVRVGTTLTFRDVMELAEICFHWMQISQTKYVKMWICCTNCKIKCCIVQ